MRKLAVICLSLLLAGLAPLLAQDPPPPLDAPVPVLVPEVISVRPHDPAAWTQGLLLYEGRLFESTGQYGASTVREVDPQTGEVLRQHSLEQAFYGEGLERVGDTLVQITWKEEVAFIYDLETFAEIGQYTYSGEGWGLCYDGRYLYMSNGQPYLYIREADSFDLIVQSAVTYRGTSVGLLRTNSGASMGLINELECVGDYVYANVWQTNFILQIDKMDGRVVALIDASGLLTAEEQAAANWLNGIAYDPEADTFLITGKYWPRMFEVRFVPAGS